MSTDITKYSESECRKIERANYNIGKMVALKGSRTNLTVKVISFEIMKPECNPFKIMFTVYNDYFKQEFKIKSDGLFLLTL